jgi:hypothetical protein
MIIRFVLPPGFEPGIKKTMSRKSRYFSEEENHV